MRFRHHTITLLALLAPQIVCLASRPRDVSVGAIARGECSGEQIRTHGTIAEVFPDAIDSAYVHMFLASDGQMIDVAFPSKDLNLTNLVRLVNADVRVKGTCLPKMGGWRHHSAPFVMGDADIEVLNGAPEDPFDAELMETAGQISTQRILNHDRMCVDGVVRAAWRQRHLLVETPSGLKVRVNLARHCRTTPKCGDGIRVVGRIDTDTANLFLTSAAWRPTATAPSPDRAPVPLTEEGFREDKFCSHLDTQPVTVTATVRAHYGSTDAPNRLSATIGSVPIQIDSGNNANLFKDIRIGSVIRATGILLVETETWSRRTPFPHITGYALILRTPDDIAVLHAPPWWTVRRLLVLLYLLIALLVGILVWNFSLNRRAKAKGRELAAEQLAHVTSELKVNERTRLAVELHDALSQTLSGVSMQIDTAVGLAEGKVPTISKCLALASRTIDACRTELRNTLWDLRSDALDETSLDAAIRKTLCLNLSGVDLRVRFNVTRETFSDKTVHVILKIIRELATNAIRHGKADSLKIAGTVDGDQVLFSVKDNGCGFDPDLAPGIAQGHFGLQGISERLAHLNGDMKIESHVGQGTNVTVILPVPHSESITLDPTPTP